LFAIAAVLHSVSLASPLPRCRAEAIFCEAAFSPEGIGSIRLAVISAAAKPRAAKTFFDTLRDVAEEEIQKEAVVLLHEGKVTLDNVVEAGGDLAVCD